MAHDDLLALIDRFLADTGLSPSYFGERAVGNSKLVARLRGGRSIELRTERRIRAFMKSEGAIRRTKSRRVASAMRGAGGIDSGEVAP